MMETNLPIQGQWNFVTVHLACSDPLIGFKIHHQTRPMMMGIAMWSVRGLTPIRGRVASMPVSILMAMVPLW